LGSFKKPFQILYYLFRPHKKLLCAYLITLIVYSILDVFRISLIYPIINYGLNISTGSTFIDGILQFVLPQTVNPFVASALLLAVVSIIIVGVELVVAYLGSKTFAVVRDKTDRAVFASIKNQPYDYFTRHKQGDLLYVGQIAVDQTGGAVNSFVSVIQYGLLCLFYLLFIFIIAPGLGIVLVFCGLIYIFLIKNQFYARVYRQSSILNTAAIEKSVVYNEFITGIKTILINDSVAFWAKKYDAVIQKLLKSYTRVMILQRLPNIMNSFLTVMIISLGAVGLYYYTNGDFLPYVGFFGTFMFALYRLMPALNSVQTQLGQIYQDLPALEAVYSMLQESVDTAPLSDNLKKPFTFYKSICFRNVSFRYNASRDDTIRNLSFEIKKNTKVAIVGNSGAGKTTVANLLACLYQPTAGEILVDGTNLYEFNHSDYLKSLGYLGQETFVYHDTIKENIRFGLECTDEEIIEAAQLANAHEFIMATPEGYDTIIGDQGMKLSGGQRQRVAIARVILRKPEILLLDEATSSLDNISEQRVMESVDRISKDMTVVIIAHRLSTVQNAEVIYVLKCGSVCESGTHEELLDKKGEYYELYNMQDVKLIPEFRE
jgi:ATP-binding cassette subfamily B protein